ncbi:alpha/beta fold hydrolase [Brevundimonas diminuta]|uniref:alpha/beta fold hydrolase n=1 Tax=Brevundimonas diminuta TaxID=293 RepID=UPI00320A51C8
MASCTETHHVHATGDCDIHYWMGGREGAPLVVLSPGAFTDHRMFDDQIGVLQKRFRTLRWDPRGHGLSRPSGRAFSTVLAAQDLISILDALGEIRVALVGQSIGGNISQEVLFHWPERVSAAVLLGCTCSTIGPSWIERWLLDLTPALIGLYPTASFKRQVGRKSAISQHAAVALSAMASPLSRSDIRAIAEGIAGAIHDEPCYRIQHPILIVRGARDNLGNLRRISERWHARDPRSVMLVIPEAGHVANMDNPGGFNTAMVEFLTSATSAGSEGRGS